MVYLQGLMESCPKGKVKFEFDDDEVGREQFVPLDKRPKLDFSLQGNLIRAGAFEVSPENYDPLNEPSPLGLHLKKSESFLQLVQTKLSQEQVPKSLTSGNKNNKGATSDKLKASNFPASILRIGTWEYKSRYEGDLVAKCYFAKHKLVWEVLDGALKNKIEMQWSDILWIKANYAVDGSDHLDVVLARQPLFYRETNPQPRKHTLWQPTSDFTTGQASMHRRHLLQCPQGLMARHFEKLIQCDPRLNYLSQQPEIMVDSPYFESKTSPLDDKGSDLGSQLGSAEASSLFGMANVASPNTIHSWPSKNNHQDILSMNSQNYLWATSSPSSVMDNGAIEEAGASGVKEQELLSLCSQIKVPGLRHSMSVSELVGYIGHCISERRASGDPVFSAAELGSTNILEGITQYLLSDSQVSASDEQALLSRVNSLCCLLQKDHVTAGNKQMIKKGDDLDAHEGNSSPERRDMVAESNMVTKPDNESLKLQGQAMLRSDSVGELLLNLPRIASLPHILMNLPEDSKRQSR